MVGSRLNGVCRVCASANNPVAIFSLLMRRVTGTRTKIFYSVWSSFFRYVYITLVKGDRGKAESVVYELEQAVPYLQRLLKKYPTDTHIELSTLAYFVLSHRGVIDRYRKGLVDTLLKTFERCYQDYELGIASPFASPALGKCLGLSHIVYDALKEDKKSLVRDMVKKCAEDPLSSTYLCTQLAFTITLYTILKPGSVKLDDVHAILSGLASVPKFTDIDVAALAMITNGLARIFDKRFDEMSALTLFTNLTKLLAAEGRALRLLDKTVWLKIRLALKLNNLDKIVYVPKDYVAVRKEDLNKTVKEIREATKALKTFGETLLYVINIIALTLAGISYFKDLAFMLHILSFLAPALTLFVAYSNKHKVEEVKTNLEHLMGVLEHLLTVTNDGKR